QDAGEHLLLVSKDAVSEIGRLDVADRACEPLDRGVGRDLQRLGGAGVLGVLEDLLLTAGAAHQIKRGLAERQRLTECTLPEVKDGREGVRTLIERVEAIPDALGM